MTNVLISGAGVAGSTLAYWLARHGYEPTVVERSPGLRSSGNPVDVRGPALPVVEAMGVLPRLREVATRTTTMRLLDAAGRRVASVGMPAAGGGEVEVPRADLAAVLHEAARHDAEFLFDDTITGLHQDDGGVEVAFDRAGPRRFDLVIGADGLHSTVRRLAFGPERDFVRHAGLHVATTPLGERVDHPREVLIQNTPGRLVSIHPGRDEALLAFIFRGTATGVDHRDTDAHKRIVTQAYSDLGWRVPQLLQRFQAAEDVFFDAVSVVDLPAWSTGRIALLGDAASCVSLLGDGSSLAIAGAHTLATALADHPSDHTAGFGRYESVHRARVTPKQRGLKRSAALLVPKTRLGLATRNLAARLRPGTR
ncbi:FAD-dependent monooxygenase [Saccharothrix variisporea]|uniref:2-polyprenyl-6-methoxyphenol hydroxylase-like FAD-dependent oxidoreductase n=1 Tax=Saccharothrix variisporea TaxID=543527 RepID=A0A495XQ67_9PSEU|nr:FAD-dependent monooxygenase [Saccharothrix variisporea]RKT75026.1 2-polyprenyl-6-methoxyphenol hydroxylase-like FAD-dependent oxidoreductase [Saccharothrix variisporea]